MTADKRTPHTDALETLGSIHIQEEKRDAIHLGVEPVEAGEKLGVGATIGIKDGKAYKSTKQNDIKALGIVDPFLTRSVLPGQKFWLVVMPRQITSLRHVWEHPDFPDSHETGYVETSKAGTDVLKAEEWLSSYAEELDLDLEELINYGRSNAFRLPGSWEEYLCKGSNLEGQRTPMEFWENLAIYLGIDIPEENKTNFFTCSC
ncbi:TPA: hypothetical protein ACTYZB_004858 [Klebsiella variicola]